MFMNAFEFGFALFLAFSWLGGQVYEKTRKED